MTIYHYIGSPYELPTGSFGIKETLVPLSEVSPFNRNPKKEKLDSRKSSFYSFM